MIIVIREFSLTKCCGFMKTSSLILDVCWKVLKWNLQILFKKEKKSLTWYHFLKLNLKAEPEDVIFLRCDLKMNITFNFRIGFYCFFVIKEALNINFSIRNRTHLSYVILKGIAEADLGLLQHPRWRALW